MSEYGRAWEKHRREREDHQRRVDQLIRMTPSNMTFGQLSGLINGLQEIERRWRADEERLKAVPE